MKYNVIAYINNQFSGIVTHKNKSDICYNTARKWMHEYIINHSQYHHDRGDTLVCIMQPIDKPIKTKI